MVQRRTVNAQVATVQGSIPDSYDIVKSEVRADKAVLMLSLLLKNPGQKNGKKKKEEDK